MRTRVDYFHFFTFSPISTRRRMASAPTLQIKQIHNRENDQSDNEPSQFGRYWDFLKLLVELCLA